jgi:hypothetical protein
MSNLVKLLTGVAGLAAVAGFATPAAAQYYPGYGYNNGGVVGAIINGVVGGGQYGYGYGNYGGNDRYAVAQCSRAVEARLGGYNSYGGYGRSYGGYGYNGYNSGGRVLGITRVERRSSGVRVRGIATGGNGYGNLTFSCKVDYRGRITDLDFNRQNYGYNGYYRGY